MVPPPHTDWQWYTREDFIRHYGSEPAGAVKWGAAIEPAKRKHLHWHPSAERRVVATVNSDGIAYTYHEFMEFFSSVASFYWDLAVPLKMPSKRILAYHMNHARFDRVMKIDFAEEESSETEVHSPRRHLHGVRGWQCRCWRVGMILLGKGESLMPFCTPAFSEGVEIDATPVFELDQRLLRAMEKLEPLPKGLGLHIY